MKERKTNRSLNHSIALYVRLFIVVSIIFGGAFITLSILSIITSNLGFVIALVVLTGLFAALIILGFIVVYRYIFNLFYLNLYETTVRNTEAMANYRKDIQEYKTEGLVEMATLNENVIKLKKHLDQTIILNKTSGFEGIDLKYVMENNNVLVSLESMLNNMQELILAFESYRCAFVLFSYDVEKDMMSDLDYFNLYDLLTSEYKGLKFLLAKNERQNGYLAFLPQIDSLSYFEEKLNKIAKNAIFSTHGTGGDIGINLLKVSAVIYPYSDISDIQSDLRYAQRQGKTVSIYTPERLNRINKDVYHTSLMQNNIAKIFEKISKIQINSSDTNLARRELQKNLRNIADYLNVEIVGMASFNQQYDDFYVEYEAGATSEDYVFKKNGIIDADFIEKINEVADLDSSYFFTNRNNVHSSLGYYLDIFGIKGGYFFLVRGAKGIAGLIYYLNKKDDLYVDAYGRETLTIFSNTLAGFNRELEGKSTIDNAISRYQDILKLTDYNIYSIYRDNYDLVEISEGLSIVKGQLVNGEKCYKKLYGLDAPCADCPLNAKKKKTSQIGKKIYETSFILNKNSKERIDSFLLKPLKGDDEYLSTNRYDPHLLIRSNYALSETLENAFRTHGRGYILLINFDNYSKLLEAYGEEGYEARLRHFFDELVKSPFGTYDLYAYRNDMVALFLQGEGRVDFINRVEKIYDLMLNGQDDRDDVRLSPTFLGFEFPSDCASHEQMLRRIDRYIKDNQTIFGHDNLVLTDYNYVRDASRSRFIEGLIENALQNDALSVKFLPAIYSASGQIKSAEILLRMADTYRNLQLYPQEFITIATKTGKIGRITDYLINQIGSIYQNHGLTTFKLTGLSSLTFNTDATYFDDEEFLSHLKNLLDKYKFPKKFLGAEITEYDIANNYEKISAVSKSIAKMDISLICDQYSGKYASLDRIKSLGFNTIKISRNLISDIDTDITVLDKVKDLIDDIKVHRMDYCLVGVETKAQFNLLKEIDPDFIAQGYYFYQPIDLDKLLDELKLSINVGN